MTDQTNQQPVESAYILGGSNTIPAEQLTPEKIRAAYTWLDERAHALAAAKHAEDDAHAKLITFEDEHMGGRFESRIPYPPRIDSADALVDFLIGARQIADRHMALKMFHVAACDAREAIEREIKHDIPYGVWFRVGDLAVGKWHDNWGGSHEGVDVQPWTDDLPSLDHTYRGD